MLRSLCLGLLLSLVASGCGRDLSMPAPPEESGPTELGALAGHYRMTVPETVRVGGRVIGTAIPVSGIGIIQHLALPGRLAEEVGGDPLVMGLVPPGGLDLSNGLELSDGGTTYGFGFVDGEALVGGKVLSANPTVLGDFSLQPMPGAGLATVLLEGCPGLSSFGPDRPLYLERSCRFAPSRSGVYAGCAAGCEEGCDPDAGPPTHFVAAGFTPMAGQPLDFVVATSYWKDEGARPWVPNLVAGVYDRFEARGVALAVDVSQPLPAPGLFSLQQSGGFLDLAFRQGAHVSPASPDPFVIPTDMSDVGGYQMATGCETSARIRRAQGGARGVLRARRRSDLRGGPGPDERERPAGHGLRPGHRRPAQRGDPGQPPLAAAPRGPAPGGRADHE
ncbi:MAG: hypothetical protein P1V51_15710 [Deltaproteobacteria bacterium]|nr:hypothetical protein [Deltaproteobacteria bacterium]